MTYVKNKLKIGKRLSIGFTPASLHGKLISNWVISDKAWYGLVYLTVEPINNKILRTLWPRLGDEDPWQI